MSEIEGACVVRFLPNGIAVTVPVGMTIADAAERAGVSIPHSCGGKGTCGKCRVRVTEMSNISPPSDTEKKALSSADMSAGIRLACCAAVQGDCGVFVECSAGNQHTKILHNIESRDITVWDEGVDGYGVAVDIGTTTVVCCLLDFRNRRVLDTEAFLNPQIKYGDDVVSRISCCCDDTGLAKLHGIIVDAIDKAALEVSKRNNVRPCNIKMITIAANTVMQHILMGVSPKSIGVAPYEPAYYSHKPVSASSLGFVNVSSAAVCPLPNAAGYVGSDIVAGVEAVRLYGDGARRLMVDIGTNNEIAVSTERGMFCCAAAAGPALEGARIRYGMRAEDGAIDHVWMSEDGLSISTIGSKPAMGICGSGLVDAVAVLLNAGIIKNSGKIISREACCDERLVWRIVKDDRGRPAVLLAEAGNMLCITQKDVREFQLAAAAIRAGIEVMLERGEVCACELESVILAGAFGNYINVENAIRVGLLPDVSRNIVCSVGNSSGLGACMALASQVFRARCDECAKMMRYVELSMLDDFQERFVRSMTFKSGSCAS